MHIQGSDLMKSEMPLIPMGAITGRPDRRQIHSFLSSFKEAGFTQYMIYPRSGCELEYLSEEWFNTCEIIISECQALGFDSVWLYDEFNWPSGQCGGRIMKEDPDHALKYFQVFEKNGEYSFGISSNPKAPDVLNPGAMKKFTRTMRNVSDTFSVLSSKDFLPMNQPFPTLVLPQAMKKSDFLITRDWKKIMQL